MPRSSPPPPAPLHPSAMHAPGAARQPWVERRGEGAGRGDQRPPYHPLTLATPNSAPDPTPTTPRTVSLCLPSESQVEAVQKAESGSGWGGVGGLGG